MSLIIYTENITPRLQYIVKVLHERNVVLTNDINQFQLFDGKKINYSNTNFDSNIFWIQPYGLLEQKGIEKQDTTCFLWQNVKVFFKTNGTIPFDFYSAAFYLITRYEEYFTKYITDNYGNYHHTNSIAFKEDFLNRPQINVWQQLITWQYGISFFKNEFSVFSTYDVDIAFAYQQQPLLKNIGGFAKDILLQRGTFIERWKTLLHQQNDPYDVFDWLQELSEKYPTIATRYFFLVAKNHSQYDKNPIRTSEAFLKLLNKIASKNAIGIHPSYCSNSDKNILQDEYNFLRKIFATRIYSSRQHYLQLKLPNTYQQLIELKGITEDFSMGYGTHNGFRASYCSLYKWYNLQDEAITKLTIHPFCYMDSNSIFEQKLTPQQALQEMLSYYYINEEYAGYYYFIMHNHFLANQPQWQPWRNIYEEFLKQISEDDY